MGSGEISLWSYRVLGQNVLECERPLVSNEPRHLLNHIQERGSHCVQIYEDSKFLYSSVALFISAGLLQNEGAIIICRDENIEGFKRALRKEQIDVEAYLAQGQLVILSATPILAQLMDDRLPNPEKFERVMGKQIEKLTHIYPWVRCYGEMVGILWCQGNPEATLKLEQLWNELGQKLPFSLLCGYSVQEISQTPGGHFLEGICHAHSHTFPSEKYLQHNADPLKFETRGSLQFKTQHLNFDPSDGVETKAALKDSQALLHATIENAAVGVCQVSSQGEWVNFNPKFCEMLGYTPAEMANIQPRALTHPEDRPQETENYQKLVRGQVDSIQREKRYLHKTGRVIWGLVSASVVRNPDATPKSFVAVIQDITEKKKVEQELQKSILSRDQFLATLSHELRTPLNVILGWVDMLRKNYVASESYEQALETLDRNARIQKELIDDLLDVSRIITGKMNLELQPTELRSIVESQILLALPQVKKKNLDLSFNLGQSTIAIMGDPLRLGQLFANILGNAIKFTPIGGKIEVHLELLLQEAILTVKDSGHGIDESFIGQIFEPLKQEDMRTTRVHGGLGLGLAIARHIVDQHQGSISVQSEGRDQGSLFKVRLPVVLTGLMTQKNNIALNLSDYDLSGIKVLVVDDSEDLLMLIGRWLRNKGAVVATANSAQAALHVFKDFRPDVLLSDIGMPDEDGYSLLNKIRALSPEEGGKTPAAALTAYARVEERDQALDAGFQIHVAKPVTRRHLEQTVVLLSKYGLQHSDAVSS